MAHEAFDPYALLDALRAGGDVDVIRSAVELVLQAVIEAQPTEAIGAAPNERTATRTNWRNGHRERLLSTKAGDVELKVPKLRRGSLFPRSSGAQKRTCSPSRASHRRAGPRTPWSASTARASG